MRVPAAAIEQLPEQECLDPTVPPVIQQRGPPARITQPRVPRRIVHRVPVVRVHQAQVPAFAALVEVGHAGQAVLQAQLCQAVAGARRRDARHERRQRLPHRLQWRSIQQRVQPLRGASSTATSGSDQLLTRLPSRNALVSHCTILDAKSAPGYRASATRRRAPAIAHRSRHPATASARRRGSPSGSSAAPRPATRPCRY